MASLATNTISTFIIMISMIVNLATAAATHPHRPTLTMTIQARSLTNGSTNRPFDLGVFWESQNAAIKLGLIVGGLVGTILAGILLVYILIFLGCAAVGISHPLYAVVKWCDCFRAGPAVENWLHFWSQPSPRPCPGPLGAVGAGAGVYELQVIVNSNGTSSTDDLEAARSDAGNNGSTLVDSNDGETPDFEDEGVRSVVSDADVSVLALPA